MSGAQNRWRIDKHIPVAIIATMLLQLIFVVWFFAKQDSRLETAELAINSVINESASVRERLRVLENYTTRITAQLEAVKDSSTRIESKLDGALSKKAQ